MHRFLVLLTLFAACNSSTSPTAEKGDTSTRQTPTKNAAEEKVSKQKTGIDSIRVEYQRINSLWFDSTQFSFLCDEQTKLTLLKSNGAIVKVLVDWGWVGDASTKEEWFYKDGQLIFRFVRTEGGVGNQPNTVHEARTYVANNKVVRYLQDDREIPCNNCQIKASAKEYAVLNVSTNEEAKAALCR